MSLNNFHTERRVKANRPLDAQVSIEMVDETAQEHKESSNSEDSSFRSSSASEFNSEFQGTVNRNSSKRKGSRKIKDLKQLRLLEEFFALDPEWTKDTINYISSFMNLTYLQLYKWGYDQKRKNSYKKGIRNKIRETRRRKFSANSVSDYNTMVSELFPEEEEVSKTGSDDLIDKFEQLKVKYFNMKNGEYQESNNIKADINNVDHIGTQDHHENPFVLAIDGQDEEMDNMFVFGDSAAEYRHCNSLGMATYKFPRF